MSVALRISRSTRTVRIGPRERPSSSASTAKLVGARQQEVAARRLSPPQRLESEPPEQRRQLRRAQRHSSLHYLSDLARASAAPLSSVQRASCRQVYRRS